MSESASISTLLHATFPASSPSDIAVSRHVPRLIDFRTGDRSSLISPVVVRGLARLADFTMIACLGFVIGLAYLGEQELSGNIHYHLVLALMGGATVASLELLDLYGQSALTAFLRHMPRVVAGCSIAFGLLVAGVFFLKIGAEISRVWLAVWYAAGAVALLGSRVVLAAMMSRWARHGRLYRRAVIYGGGEVTAEVLSQLEADIDSDVRICGIFDDRAKVRLSPVVSGYPRLGGLSDLVAFARRTRIDLVIVALPITAEQRLADVLKELSVLPADIRLPARATAVRFSPSTYSHVGKVAMISLLDKPIADWGTVLKWIFDKAAGLAALTLLAPVMAAVAIAIRLDSRGPVLFRQKRYGFNNELIEVYKFRSMYTDRCDSNAARLVSKDDPRVTPVGRFIRKTSLDELPQLFNVIKGDLSLVGPRPHALAAKAADVLYDEAVDGYFARHKVKPGITGWAQINGWRGETDTQEKLQKRVEHDLYYIENWSVLFDLYILLKTPFALIKAENAY